MKRLFLLFLISMGAISGAFAVEKNTGLTAISPFLATTALVYTILDIIQEKDILDLAADDAKNFLAGEPKTDDLAAAFHYLREELGRDFAGATDEEIALFIVQLESVQ